MDVRDVVCPKCRAAIGEACHDSPHRERELAAMAMSRMPAAREDDSPETRATRAARRRQQQRARDPRMNNDW